MREIKDMSVQEMEDEIRGYVRQEDRGYAFISYSHRDKEQVYPVVLSWMRAGYNIYIDLDFEKHGSDAHWIGQMRENLANINCRLAVCFRSIHYTYSYAALLELLSIRSDSITRQRGEGERLCVDCLPLEPIPSDDKIPPHLQAQYDEIFRQMRMDMGDTFAGQNPAEQKVLLTGLAEWLSGIDEKTKADLHYSACDAEGLRDDINGCYKRSADAFFRYIARLNKNWFYSKDLNGNNISPQTDVRTRFAQVGVDLVRDPVAASDPESAAPAPASEPAQPAAPAQPAQPAAPAPAPAQPARPASGGEAVGVCPRCGGEVVERPKNFSCRKRDCGFVLWKDDWFFTDKGKELTKDLAVQLLRDGKVLLKGCRSKAGKPYNAIVFYEDTGEKNVRYRMEFPSSRRKGPEK